MLKAKQVDHTSGVYSEAKVLRKKNCIPVIIE